MAAEAAPPGIVSAAVSISAAAAVTAATAGTGILFITSLQSHDCQCVYLADYRLTGSHDQDPHLVAAGGERQVPGRDGGAGDGTARADLGDRVDLPGDGQRRQRRDAGPVDQQDRGELGRGGDLVRVGV